MSRGDRQVERVLAHGVMLCAVLIYSAQLSAQVELPRNGAVFESPADRLTLASDTVDAPWTHILRLDGPVQLVVDPLLDLRLEGEVDGESSEKLQGYRNVRGVRWSGRIDQKLAFGGMLLEMQRAPVGAEADWSAERGGFPGMGRGKLSYSEASDGGPLLDHSLSSAWFKWSAAERLSVEWGLGSHRIGRALFNAVLSDGVAPAPYLGLNWRVAKRLTIHYLQRRMQGPQRLAADGVREGRYEPLGLGIRGISYAAMWKEGAPFTLTAMQGRLGPVLGRSTAEAIADLGPWPVRTDKRTDQWFALDAVMGWPSGSELYSQFVRCSPDGGARVVLGGVIRRDTWSAWGEVNGGAGDFQGQVAQPIGGGLTSWWDPQDSAFTRRALLGSAFEQGRLRVALELSMGHSKDDDAVTRGSSARIDYAIAPRAARSPIAITITAACWDKRTWWSSGLTMPLGVGRKTH